MRIQLLPLMLLCTLHAFCCPTKDISCSKCLKSHNCVFGVGADGVEKCVSSLPLAPPLSDDYWVDNKLDCAIADLWLQLREDRDDLKQSHLERAVRIAASKLSVASEKKHSRFSFSKKDAAVDKLAIMLVAHASRWAHKHALSSLADSIAASGKKFLVDGGSAMLSDALYYLMQKKGAIQEGKTNLPRDAYSVCNADLFFGRPLAVPWTLLPADAALLVDPLFLGLLESRANLPGSPLTTDEVRAHLREQLTKDSLTLLIPTGWISCVTIFNQLRLEEVVRSLASSFERHMKEKGLLPSEVGSDAIENFLKESVLARLASALDMKTDALAPHVVWLAGHVDPTALYNIDSLVRHYAQHMPPLDGFMHTMTAWFGTPETRNAEQQQAIDVLRSDAAVYSMNKLAALCRVLGQKLLKKKANVFWVPEHSKSFAFSNHLIFMNTGLRAQDFIPHSTLTRDQLPSPPKILVMAPCQDKSCDLWILDDISSSGDQLHVYEMTYNAKVASLIATTTAVENLPQLLYASKVVLPDPATQKWSLNAGMKDQMGLFSFPHMSPDNNGPLGARVLASFFTPMLSIKFGLVHPDNFQLANWSRSADAAYNSLFAGLKARDLPEHLFLPLAWL